MSYRNYIIGLLPLCALVLIDCAVSPSAPWRHPLYLDNGGIWRCRIPVTIKSPVALDGESWTLDIGGGIEAKSIRVVDSEGRELLFRQDGGKLTFPLVCPADSQRMIYVYFDNPKAIEVPDMLPETAACAKPCTVKAGPVESLKLRSAEADEGWPAGATARVKITTANFSDTPVRDTLVSADLSRVLFLMRGKAAFSGIMGVASGMDGRCVLFKADLPPRTVRTFYACFGSGPGKALDSNGLVLGPANRVLNPGFEAEIAPEDWILSPGAAGQRISGGKAGGFCVSTTVPPGVAANWTGWRQTIAIEPGGLYLIGCWIKSKDLDGNVTLYAHALDRDKRLVSVNPFIDCAPQLYGTQEWTWVQTRYKASPDAEFLELHLTMNAHGTTWHDGVIVRRLKETLSAQAGQLEYLPDTGLRIWQAGTVEKIFRDHPAGEEVSSLSCALARNEGESIQLVLKSDRALAGVQVQASRLIDSTGRRLPPVEVRMAGYVPVDAPSAYYPIDVPAWQRKIPVTAPLSDGWAGDWPDPLVSFDSLDLLPGQAQPVWLTVHAPANAFPGTYTGAVTIKGPGLLKTMPFVVRVRSFALPNRPSLQVTYDAHAFRGATASPWYAFMARHRISCGYLPEPGMSLMPDGTVSMDFTAMDQVAALCFDTLSMAVMYTPMAFYASGWGYSPQRFLGTKAFTPEWEKAFGSALGRYAAHIREKGWSDRIAFYLSDEPAGDNPEVMESLRKFSAFVRSIAPELPVYSSTWRYMPALDGAITRWGAGHYGIFPVETIKDRLSAGEKVCFTTDGQLCLDTPFSATERMLPWFCFKYNVEGYEFWGVDWKTYDPWKYGWHRFLSQNYSDSGAFSWVRFPNGDGYLAYPGPAASVRLEAVRDGLEDYEYFRLLERCTDSLSRALLQEAMALVNIPNPGGLKTGQWFPGPDRISNLREKIADQIEGACPKPF